MADESKRVRWKESDEVRHFTVQLETEPYSAEKVVERKKCSPMY